MRRGTGVRGGGRTVHVGTDVKPVVLRDKGRGRGSVK